MSQLSGSQGRHSFLPGTGVTLKGGVNPLTPPTSVWARDGQAPVRAQASRSVRPCQATWVTSDVQYMHRVAAIGIVLRHCGQSRVVTALLRFMRAVIFATGATIRK